MVNEFADKPGRFCDGGGGSSKGRDDQSKNSEATDQSKESHAYYWPQPPLLMFSLSLYILGFIVYKYIYIYIYRERERELERES
jgi:hypothetical protein